MKSYADAIIFASREAVASWGDAFRLLFVSGILFWLLVMIPVWTTPGNDFLFQLKIAGPWVVVLMAVLSLLNGLLIVMHLHIRRVKKATARLHVKDVAGGMGSIGGALIATIGCASCYSSLLSVLGAGSVGFLVEYRWLIATLALTIAIAAISFTAKRIKHGCAVCSL